VDEKAAVQTANVCLRGLKKAHR